MPCCHRVCIRMWISMNRFLCSSLVLWTLAGNETYMLLMPKPTFSINIKVSLHEIRSKVSKSQQCKTAKRFWIQDILKIYDIWTWQSYTIMTYIWHIKFSDTVAYPVASRICRVAWNHATSAVLSILVLLRVLGHPGAWASQNRFQTARVSTRFIKKPWVNDL